MNGFEVCVPNDHIICVDDASQGAVFNSKAISYDDAGSAFKAVDKNITHILCITSVNNHITQYLNRENCIFDQSMFRKIFVV